MAAVFADTSAPLPLLSAAVPNASGAAPAPSARALSARPVLAAAPRPPKAPPPRKARTAAECERLEQLPNIGPSIAGDLRLLGVLHPGELAEADPLQLYQRLSSITGKRQDPCVLDTFMAATAFMRGAAPRPWWDYTAQRKRQYGPL